MVKACSKKILRFRISNVVLNRKLFTQNSRTSANNRKYSKFIWIDDFIENEWKTLKSKSGYTTDKLFLKYLLSLAAKDLYGDSNSNGNITNLPRSDKLSVYLENSSNSNRNKCVSQNVEKEKKVVEHKKEKFFVKGKKNFKNPGTNDMSEKSLGKHNFSENGDMVSKNINSECKKKVECTGGTRIPVLNEFYNISSGQKNSNSILEGKQIDSLFGENQINEDTKCFKNMRKKKKKESFQTLVRKEKVTTKSKSPRKLKKKQKKRKEETTDNKSHLVSRVIHSESVVFDNDFNKECLKTGEKLLSDVENNIYNLSNCVFISNNNNKETLAQREERLLLCNTHQSLDKRYKANKIVVVTNSSSTDGSSKIYVKSFATTTLPSYLYFKTVYSDHGLSVFSKTFIAKSTQLGPLLGQRIKEKDISDDVNMKDIWEIHLKDGISYLSTEDTETSNWLRFIRPAENRATTNLLIVVKEENLYFETIKDVNDGDELVYWTDDCHPAWSKKKLDKKNCGGCNLQFGHILYYRKHCMIFHDPNSSLTTKKFHCKVCGLAVLGKEKIMKHAAEFHQGKGAYQCQYCHKFFLRLNYLETHRSYGCAKNPHRSRPLCDLCGRKFCQPQKLKIHMKRMHSDISQVLSDFQCKNCQKILGCRAALQRHLKEVHNKDVVGAFTCDRCGKIFQNKSNLKIHMLTHSGIKPFKCQELECNAGFTTKQCLQLHYKKIHGFTDDIIPKIERSVAFTFDAYSGGIFSGLEQESSFALQHSAVQKNKGGLDLTLATPSNQGSIPGGKLGAFKNLLSEETNLIEELDNRYVNDKDFTEKTSPEDLNKINCEIISGDNGLSSAKANETDSMVINKSNKHFWESDSTIIKTDTRTKRFSKENVNNSPLMEPVMSRLEKDIFEKPVEVNKSSCIERLGRNDLDISSLDQCIHPSNIESSDKGMDIPLLDSSKVNCLAEKDDKKDILSNDRSNYNDIFKFNNLKNNSSPISEVPRNCNVDIRVREEDESPSEVDLSSNRSRDFIDTCKGTEVYYENHRNQDEMSRSDKMDSFRSSEFDFRFLSSDKFDCRDFDFSSEYRSIVNSMEKTRNEEEFHRGRGEGYDLQIDCGRMMGNDRDGEAQNLCLKKPYHCESMDELTKIGRDNSGFETVFSNEASGSNLSQNFGAPFLRSSHGMMSPRPYHQTPFESESVDLTVPRPAFSTSPVYSLDLTSSRLDLSTRHLDFRGHLGLSTMRLGNSSSPMANNDSSAHMSPTGYDTYQSSYGISVSRTCQTSQFQPYTPLYY